MTRQLILDHLISKGIQPIDIRHGKVACRLRLIPHPTCILDGDICLGQATYGISHQTAQLFATGKTFGRRQHPLQKGIVVELIHKGLHHRIWLRSTRNVDQVSLLFDEFSRFESERCLGGILQITGCLCHQHRSDPFAIHHFRMGMSPNDQVNLRKLGRQTQVLLIPQVRQDDKEITHLP